MKALKRGTLNCPSPCGESLHFKNFQYIRVVTNGVYHARCPKCGKYWDVKA